jgi:kinetochore protein Nuf2
MSLVQQYMYPLMDPIDIIESFADWSISITQQQLSRPSPDFVTYIYAACVRQVTGLLQENLEEAVTNVLRESDDPNPVCSC